MTPRKTRAEKTITVDRWGVLDGYRDSAGMWRATRRQTRFAIRAAMGQPPDVADPKSVGPIRVVKAGTRVAIPGRGELTLEDGTTLAVAGLLPSDLPVGYHDLHLAWQDRPQRIIVSPREGCYIPDDLEAWGWSVQLYALRSGRSWGIGDLADLRRFVKWSSTETSAGVLLLNPLCAATPVLPQQPSPYYPSSRLYRNPLYLSVEAVPVSAGNREAINRLAAAGRALNDRRLIDRDAVFKIKMSALEQLWRRFRPTPAFDRYRTQQGQSLELFATYCVLAERYGADWHAWPVRFRRPESAAVKGFAAASIPRVQFHQWLQWLLDDQLGRVTKHSDLIMDMPVGVDPCGADAWRWQNALAAGVRVGAPPDRFNTLGQDWGLQPFVPHHLQAMRYAPFIEGLRAAFRHAAGLRIDHVMGMFRLFWVPRCLTPDKGAYVAYPSEEILAVLAVESHRAKAFVVGEDLGTVEAGVRRRLARHGVLGCAVMWFERQSPARYRSRTLASVTTHDLPTVAGLWSGDDLRVQRDMGLDPPEDDYQKIRRRLRRLTGLTPDASVQEVVRSIHRELACGASLLRVVTVDDALGVAERPNMPGTTVGYPSWSLALPLRLDRILDHPLVRDVSRTMGERQRRRGRTPVQRRRRSRLR